MKTGIIIPCYNRPQYLKETIRTLHSCYYPEDTSVLFIDDGSDEETKQLIYNCKLSNAETIHIFKNKNMGMADSILRGIRYFYKKNTWIILDSDMVVLPHWIFNEIELLTKFPYHIISGFDCNNNIRFENTKTEKDYSEKREIGGCNIVFNKLRMDEVLAALKLGNAWDSDLSAKMIAMGLPLKITNPGVVNHIGHVSSSNLAHSQFNTNTNF